MDNKAVLMTDDKIGIGGFADVGGDNQESLIDWKGIWKPLVLMAGVFLIFFWLPIENTSL